MMNAVVAKWSDVDANAYESLLACLTPHTSSVSPGTSKGTHQPLKIATMCSGTEAPILALQQIQEYFVERGGTQTLFQSLFAAEIEPYKQAYIHRNFPELPLIFCDVRKLANGHAETIFGTTKKVPTTEVDILIAGTSCVDYSSLNNERKGLADGGESAQTFYGMLQWLEKAKPKCVILENVCSAPWNDVQRALKDTGYASKYIKVDTKRYGLPQTRNRVYCCGFRIDDDEESATTYAEKWAETLRSLEIESDVSRHR